MLVYNVEALVVFDWEIYQNLKRGNGSESHPDYIKYLVIQ